MVVETTLADGDGAMVEVFTDARQVASRVESRRIVRVHARRVPDEPGVPFRDPAGSIGRVGRFTDADEDLRPCLTSRGDDGVSIAVERRIGEVDVTVSEHHQSRG